MINNYNGKELGDNSFGLRYHNGSNWSSQVFNLSTSGVITNSLKRVMEVLI